MYNYKLIKLAFNDGTSFEPGKLTVIVGPNNSGKSRALKDIALLATNPVQPVVVVKAIQWTMPQSLQALYESYSVEPYQTEGGSWSFHDIDYLLGDARNVGFGTGDWRSTHESRVWNGDAEFFANIYGHNMFAFLTTESRLSLVIESESPASPKQAAKLLHIVYAKGRPLEDKIKKLVDDAFKRDIVLDYTALRRLLFRVGDNFGAIPVDPREALPILTRCEKLDDQGDGIRSFVGIVVALLATNRSLVLVDEPEAFLHPPQAFRIGEFLADQSNEGRQVVIATHSADVLRGIVSKTKQVSILRLDRTGNKNYFRVLDPARVELLVSDPLLSSARVLDGLFYSGAVVVEAESDGRFYHAVSKRRRSDADLHFVNADNKQTVPRITSMYREMGVRCAGIVDFDVLNERAEFEKQLEAMALDEVENKEALNIREKIAEVVKEEPPERKIEYIRSEMAHLLSDTSATQSKSHNSDAEALMAQNKLLRQIENKCRELSDWTKPWKTFKEKGQTALPQEIQGEFDRLWQICAANGLFINPCGELESLLAEYGIPYTTDKKSWILRALQLLPHLEVNDQKQPWKFVRVMHEHIGLGS
jgi:predicted ATPase